MSLMDVGYDNGEMQFPHTHRTSDESALGAYLETAKRLASTLPRAALAGLAPELTSFEELRWFPLPHEACD